MISSILRELRFLGLAVAGLLAAGLIFAGIITLIDPFGIVPFSPSVTGFNAHKLRTGENSRLFKNYDVLRRRPEIVVFGSSRINQAISGDRIEQTTGRRAYNAGLDGGTPLEARRLLEDWLDHGVPIREAYFELYYWRVIPRPDNYPATRTIDYVRDFRTAFLSAYAARSAYKTIRNNRGGKRLPLYRADGMRSPRENWTPRPANGGLEGWWPKAELVFKLMTPEYFEPMVEIAETCRKRDVTCWFLLTPMHAIRLAYMDVAGHWESLRAFMRLAAELLPVRNFVTPGPGALTDLCEGSEYWYDPGHFSPAFGDRIVETLFAREPPEQGFGAVLTPEKLPAQLDRIQAAVTDWLVSNPTFAVPDRDGKRTFFCE